MADYNYMKTGGNTVGGRFGTRTSKPSTTYSRVEDKRINQSSAITRTAVYHEEPVAVPIAVDAYSSTRPHMVFLGPQHMTDGVVAKVETVVERVYVPDQTSTINEFIRNIQTEVAGPNRGPFPGGLLQRQTPNSPESHSRTNDSDTDAWSKPIRGGTKDGANTRSKQPIEAATKDLRIGEKSKQTGGGAKDIGTNGWGNPTKGSTNSNGFTRPIGGGASGWSKSPDSGTNDLGTNRLSSPSGGLIKDGSQSRVSSTNSGTATPGGFRPDRAGWTQAPPTQEEVIIKPTGDANGGVDPVKEAVRASRFPQDGFTTNRVQYWDQPPPTQEKTTSKPTGDAGGGTAYGGENRPTNGTTNTGSSAWGRPNAGTATPGGFRPDREGWTQPPPTQNQNAKDIGTKGWSSKPIGGTGDPGTGGWGKSAGSGNNDIGTNRLSGPSGGGGTETGSRGSSMPTDSSANDVASNMRRMPFTGTAYGVANKENRPNDVITNTGTSAWSRPNAGTDIIGTRPDVVSNNGEGAWRTNNVGNNGWSRQSGGTNTNDTGADTRSWPSGMTISQQKIDGSREKNEAPLNPSSSLTTTMTNPDGFRPNHVGWSQPPPPTQEKTTSKPTGYNSGAVDPVKEAPRDPRFTPTPWQGRLSAPKKAEVIDSNEAAQKYNGFIAPSVGIIDSNEAARRYLGKIVP